MACTFHYGFVALKFTMERRDRKRKRKKKNEIKTRDLWSVSFNLTNTLGFAKQYIYPILNINTESYLIKQKLELY